MRAPKDLTLLLLCNDSTFSSRMPRTLRALELREENVHNAVTLNPTSCDRLPLRLRRSLKQKADAIEIKDVNPSPRGLALAASARGTRDPVSPQS
jgi:hypothetical protein